MNNTRFESLPAEPGIGSVLDATKNPTDRRSVRRGKPGVRRAMQAVRRAHLYFGLFLLPWALLYGVTGFLFNHPAFFADSPIIYFDKSDLSDAGLAGIPELNTVSASILEKLNERNTTASKWVLGDGSARYVGRDNIVATVKAGERSFFVVLDPLTIGGLIRENTTPRSSAAIAPFDTTTSKTDNSQNKMSENVSGPKSSPGIEIETIADQFRQIASTLVERSGLPAGGEAIITSTPNIEFLILVDDKEWTATCNPITKQVTGVQGRPRAELAWRSFLLRMHLSHRYPGEVNVKWIWAIGVDAIALTLCFWVLSGLMMWWQIKATRRLGTMVLLASAVTATLLAMGMHSVSSQ